MCLEIETLIPRIASHYDVNKIAFISGRVKFHCEISTSIFIIFSSRPVHQKEHRTRRQCRKGQDLTRMRVEDRIGVVIKDPSGVINKTEVSVEVRQTATRVTKFTEETAGVEECDTPSSGAGAARMVLQPAQITTGVSEVIQEGQVRLTYKDIQTITTEASRLAAPTAPANIHIAPAHIHIAPAHIHIAPAHTLKALMPTPTPTPTALECMQAIHTRTQWLVRIPSFKVRVLAKVTRIGGNKTTEVS